jgi:hypothetical protein
VLQLVDKYEKYRSSDASDFSSALQMEFDFLDTEFAIPDKDVLDEISSKLRKEEASQKVSSSKLSKKETDQKDGSLNFEQMSKN